MAFKNKSTLLTDLATNFPDNVSGAITAAIYRTFITDVLDSYLINLDPVDQTASFSVANTVDDGTVYNCKGASTVDVTLGEGTNFHEGYSIVVHRNGAQVRILVSGTDTINGGAGPVTIDKDHTSYIVFYLGTGRWYSVALNFNIEDVPAGNFPIGDGTGHLNPSALTEGTDAIVSTKTIQAPPGSFQLGGSLSIATGARVIFINNLAFTDSGGLIHFSPFDSTGSLTPVYLDLAAENTLEHQPLDDETAAVTEITYTVAANNRLVSSLIVRAAAAVSDVRMVVRKDDSNGAVLVDMSGLSASGSGDTEITFDNPIAVEIGDVLFVQLLNMGSVQLKGHTNGTFVPYFATKGHNFTKVNTDWPNDVVGAAVKSGTMDTIQFTRRDGTTFDVTLGGAVFESFDLRDFSVPTFVSRIDTTASLVGNHPATLTVDNIQNIDGDLTVLANTTPVHTIANASIVEGANSFTINISSAEWTTILGGSPSSVVFKVQGTDSMTNTVDSNTITVERRDLDDHEYLYDGLSSSNNPASIDIGTMDQAEVSAVQPQQIVVSTGTTTAGQYYIILVPADHDITSIVDDVLQQDVTSIFTKTTNVRQINSVNYHSYVLGPLNAGGDESYTVTLS